jgi:trehalose/maltose hydrolase-like predicted phosphorylase
VELDVKNGMVTKHLKMDESGIPIIQNQFAHRTKLNLLVNEFIVDNTKGE